MFRSYAGRGRGDLFVHVSVDTPTDLDDRQKELLFALAEARGEELGTRPTARGSSRSCARPSADHGAGRPPTASRAASGTDLGPRPPWCSWRIRPPRFSRRVMPTTFVDVLRLRPDELVIASDGAGSWAPCRLSGALAGREARGSTSTRCWRRRPGDQRGQACSRPSPVAFAPAKGDRPEWVTQKLTELGVDRIVPIQARRSVVRWEGERGDRAVDRLRRVAREAAAQCRRTWLPEVTAVTPLSGLASLAGQTPCWPNLGEATLRWTVRWSPWDPKAGGRRRNWAPQSRRGPGPNVLRAETAAIVAGSVLCGLRSGLIGPLRNHAP